MVGNVGITVTTAKVVELEKNQKITECSQKLFLPCKIYEGKKTEKICLWWIG